MTSCFLIRNNGAATMTVRRSAAIGDTIMASVVAQKLAQLGYAVTFQTVNGLQKLVSRCLGVARVEGAVMPPNVNLDGAKESEKENRDIHFCETFINTANRQLRGRGIDLGSAINCRPVLRVSEAERHACQHISSLGRPWIFICPRSNTWPVRQVPDGIWRQAARKMPGTQFWLGTHPAPPGIVDLRCRDVDMLARLVSVADLYVGVDTGPMHIAVAQGIPAVVILQSSSPEMHLSDQRDWTMVGPPLDCLHCMERNCPKNRWHPPCQDVDPNLIANTVALRWAAWAKPNLPGRYVHVSAVVPTYRATASRLNHCLENLLPQVDEVIVTRAADGEFPLGALRHEKVRYVFKRQAAIGFGRNVNFGVRHASYGWVLIANDDFYINPGAVKTMMDQVKPDTGILTPLIWFPDGRVYVSAKMRSRGARGWEHVDYRKATCSFPNVTETENACGCCMLIRREAFYKAGCFDEEFQFYAEDDDLSMRIRQAGYRILFVPQATGVHEEGQSTKLFPQAAQIMQASNTIFGRKWKDYLDHNANRVPLGNFDCYKV